MVVMVMVVMMVMVMNMRHGEDDQLLKGTNCRELVVAPSLQPVMMNMVIVMDMMLKMMVMVMKMMNMISMMNNDITPSLRKGQKFTCGNC